MYRTLIPQSSQSAPTLADYPFGSRALKPLLQPPLEPAEEVDFALFSPVHYENGYAYPLVIWLHDTAGSEADLTSVMPHVSMRNHVGVAPRGTEVSKDGGFDWAQTPAGIGEAVDRVLDSIAIAAERYHIHPERVFLAGVGSGGTMAMRVALERPERFAGAASIDGPVPHGCCPLRNINRARSLPLMLAHSDTDDRAKIDAVTDDLRLLHHAGFSLALRLYPGGKGLATNMLSDLDAWILDRICPSSAAVR